MDIRPVGVFDSGLGGISVLNAAVRLLPTEDFVYFGDNANAPYGDRPEEEITRLTFACADALVSRGVKALLLACNTATGTCIKDIREKLAIPVVSIEPAIKPACAAADEGCVLMLATLATTRMTRYQALVSRMPDPARVVSIACPGLANRIERGIFAADAFDDLLDRYLRPYHGMTVSGIVLGCTHYPFIREAIETYARHHFCGACRLYDGAEATARQLGRVLRENGLANNSGSGKVTFLTSGDPAVFGPLFRMLREK